MIKLGILDFDTSHTVEFTKRLNNPEGTPKDQLVEGAQIVIGCAGESKLSPTTDQQTVQTICASAMLLYERSVRPAYTMYTLSTEYQRPPQPRIIATSWPLRRLTATTVPMAQDTRVRPVNA